MRDDDAAGLIAERLLQVIDEGQRTATYKLALVLALMDACAEGVGVEGYAPESVTTRQVAEHVVRIYYPQVREYFGSAGTGVALRQISNKNSVSLAAIYRFRLEADGVALGVAMRAVPEAYERCLDEVEWNFARYPLLLLQVLGGSLVPFLYETSWSSGISRRQLDSAPGIISFQPGAADELLRIAPLVRPLVEVHWIRQVAKWNQVDVESERLRGHLFGAERAVFPDWLRTALREAQVDRCFYCDARLGSLSGEIDHVLPWSRWPNDAMENLVLTDRRCNNDKRDRLVAIKHIHRWVERLEGQGADLAGIAASQGWDTSTDRSLALMRAGYAHLPEGTPLWGARGELRVEALAPIRQLLAAASR